MINFSELEAFVFELQSINFNFSVICLQASWLYEHEDSSLIELDGYNCIAQGKTCSTKGGLIMYIHKNLKYKLIRYDVPQEHYAIPMPTGRTVCRHFRRWLN